MPEIEEIDDELELELEANPGEDDGASLDLESNPGDDGGLDLESNPGDDDGLLELEDNPGERPGGALRIGTLVLESNAAFGADGDDEDDDEDQWEIPFAMELPEAPNLDEIVDVRLLRKADERLGLVLDASNVIVALRDDTPAARSGGLFVGDTVLAVQGVACTAERRVAQLLRELPDAPTYVFTVKRALDASHSARALSEPVTEHGPLMTPEEAEAQRQREYEARMKIRDEVDALPDSHEAKAALKQQLAPQNLSETKYISSQKEADPAAKKMMNDLWYRQARDKLMRRLSAAEMLKDEGNDKFSEGEYADALDEYEYALNLFDYEMANLCRDQEAAELGDHKRGLGSEDLPAIQKIRVPCLLNSAACHIKIGQRANLTKALECCAQVLQAAPPAATRAKAHFRMGQAHFALENFREAWTALVVAQELHPASREVRALLAKVSYELKQLKVAERESREGLMTTELNHKQLFKQERLSYAAKLGMLKKLLPAEGSKEEAKMLKEVCQRNRASVLLETVASRAWTNLSGEDQMLFSSLWSSAQPRLTKGDVRDGRDAGIFPPRDEERIFGVNLPQALMSKPFPERLAWLAPEQRQRARGLALTIWQRGVEDLDAWERRVCEGLELLATGAHNAAWHARPLGAGGAQLILSNGRRHKWAFIPPTLRVQEAVAGASLDQDDMADAAAWARRRLSAGEVGALKAHAACWEHALAQEWDWCLVLDDAAKADLSGGTVQLLALLPEIAASAKAQEKDWQLLVLSPHGIEPFYELLDTTHIPSLVGDAAPAWARRPKTLGDSGWRRVGPTFHPVAWVYRASLMRALIDGLEQRAPPLNPLDVWVWEVLAQNEMLGLALAPKVPLVLTNDAAAGGPQ